MSSGAKILDHYVRPMLIPLPLGVLSMAVVFDIVRLVTGQTAWSLAAFYMIIAGIIAGLLAAMFGLIDWLAIGGGTRAKRVGALHGIGNVVVVTLFFISWWIRRPMPDAPTTTALVFSFVTLACWRETRSRTSSAERSMSDGCMATRPMRT